MKRTLDLLPWIVLFGAASWLWLADPWAGQGYVPSASSIGEGGARGGVSQEGRGDPVEAVYRREADGATGTLAGRVFGPDLHSAGRGLLVLTCKGQEERVERIGPDGYFLISELEAGTWRAHFEREGRAKGAEPLGGRSCVVPARDRAWVILVTGEDRPDLLHGRLRIAKADMRGFQARFSGPDARGEAGFDEVELSAGGRFELAAFARLPQRLVLRGTHRSVRMSFVVEGIALGPDAPPFDLEVETGVVEGRLADPGSDYFLRWRGPDGVSAFLPIEGLATGRFVCRQVPAGHVELVRRRDSLALPEPETWEIVSSGELQAASRIWIGRR